MSIYDRLQNKGKHTYFLGVFLLSASLLLCLFVTASVTYAAPNTIHYQGRLADSNGVNMPDGLYNMTFRIYDAATSGNLVWSWSTGTGSRIQVTNGQFSVTLSNVDTSFTGDTRFLEVELPTPATATCSTAGCANYSEGPMTPRQAFASAAYAFQAENADTLDGIDSLSFARKDGSNTFTLGNTFNGNTTIGSTNSATKFVINNNSSVALFTADTSSTIVKVGTTSAATLANVRLLTTSAEFSGTVRIGTATDGIDISGASGILLSGTARPTRTVTLDPEYAGATFRGDGTSNLGSLSSDFCSNTASLSIDTTACPTSGDVYNFYQWTTTETTAQDYDVYVRYKLPSDYSAGSMANLGVYAQSSSAASNVNLYMYDNTGTTCATVLNTSYTAVPAWTQTVAASPIGSCTGLVGGSYVTFKVRMFASTGSSSRVGPISFEYRSKF